MPYWAVGFFHGLNLAVLDEPEMAFLAGPAVPDWLWAPTSIGYFFPAQIGCELPALTTEHFADTRLLKGDANHNGSYKKAV